MTARDFNGSTDRLDWANIGFDPVGTGCTFSTWVDYDTLVTSARCFVIHQSGDTNWGLLFHHGGSAQQMVVNANCSSGAVNRASGNVLTTGKHHLFFTWDGTNNGANIHHYIDNVETSTGGSTSGGNLSAIDGSLSLGGFIFSDTTNIDGRQWHSGFWNRILSADERAALAAGYHPSFFENGLVWCPDLSSLKDPYSGLTGTADGTTTLDSQGPQILPCGPMVWTAAPTSTGNRRRRLLCAS